MRLRMLCALLFVGLAAGACSTQNAYWSAQEMQRAQCDRLTDLQEMQRCRAQTHQPYEDYQRQVEAIKPAP